MTTELAPPRDCALQREKPPQWEAHAPQLESSPCAGTKTQWSQKQVIKKELNKSQAHTFPGAVPHLGLRSSLRHKAGDRSPERLNLWRTVQQQRSWGQGWHRGERPTPVRVPDNVIPAPGSLLAQRPDLSDPGPRQHFDCDWPRQGS